MRVEQALASSIGHSSGHEDRVVADSFEITPQQRQVESHPRRIILGGENVDVELPLPLVELVVAAGSGEGDRSRVGVDRRPCLSDQVLGDVAHGSYGLDELLWHYGFRIPLADELSDMDGQIADALQVTAGAEYGHYRSQVVGNRLLSRDESYGKLIDLLLGCVEADVTADHRMGSGEVSVQYRLGARTERLLGEASHSVQRGSQLV
jgi:hypothetical protein